ncbi:hypothetical protein [Kutzneria sp. CA-103260]|uniref:hypothetical protein n=1 Tax=Kutzneria sp. CA-103260 TaxID=2802641 RepID=UPI001BA56773|nr:hypothetical protein [Kutzneria sp. CA-103260]
MTVDYDGFAELLHSPEFRDVIQQVAAHARVHGLRLRNHEPVPIEVFLEHRAIRVKFEKDGIAPGPVDMPGNGTFNWSKTHLRPPERSRLSRSG